MRASLLSLALLGSIAFAAAPVQAAPLVECAAPPPAPVSWSTCFEFWAEVDAGYCLRADDAAACVRDEGLACTLDAPPSRCGNHVVAFGFRGA